MTEELFHYYQSTQYANMGQYNANSGWVNIEFEQAVWSDIQKGSSVASALNGSDAATIQAYQNWINVITNTNTTYPKSMSDLQGEYQTFLLAYSQTQSFGAPISLNPTAMLANFSTYGCK